MNAISWLPQRLLGVAACLTLFCINTRADVVPFLGLGSEFHFSSNVYLNDSYESDGYLGPSLDVGFVAAELVTMGYSGEAEVYLAHPDLLFHGHTAFVSLAPIFGADQQNEFIAELSLRTEQNSRTYLNLNVLIPSLYLETYIETGKVVSWTATGDLSYRWFYNDLDFQSVDGWGGLGMTFTFPSRTTITPRFNAGMRTYPVLQLETAEDRDVQLKPGIHFSQGLWRNAGLQFDYAYYYLLAPSQLLRAQMATDAFDLLDETFLFSGHQGRLGLKQIFTSGWKLGFDAWLSFRNYQGWHEESLLTGEIEQRDDVRSSTEWWLGYASAGDVSDTDTEASTHSPLFDMTLRYGFLRQWSSVDYYDTAEHHLTASLQLLW